LLGIKKVLGLHPLTGIVVGIKFRNLVEIKTQKKPKFYLVIIKKVFTFAPRKRLKLLRGKFKTYCERFFKKKSNFYLVIKKKGFTFAAA